MNEIRVLHIMDKVSVDGSKMHGPARQIAYRAPYYPRDRVKIMLLNLRGEDLACDSLRRSGIEVVSLNKGKFNPLALFDVVKVIREWRPSVLHVHGYASSNFGRIAGRLMRIPTVVQEHFVDEHLPACQQALDFLLRRWQDKALAVSEAVKEFMTHDRSIPDADIEVLLNGVPVDKVTRATPDQIQALRRTLAIPDGARVIGTAGRLAEMKGHHIFLQAARVIARQDPSARFILVGDGPWAGVLKEQTVSLGLTDRVIFTGYQENVVPYLSLFDVGVVASIFNEGFNTVGVEIMAVGAPLVITDLPCFHDAYRHGENVLMVPTRDADALAEAVLRLLADAPLRARLQAGGRATVEKCGIDRIASRYVALYEELSKGNERNDKAPHLAEK